MIVYESEKKLIKRAAAKAAVNNGPRPSAAPSVNTHPARLDPTTKGVSPLIGLRLPAAILATIDECRGNLSRQQFIRRVLVERFS